MYLCALNVKEKAKYWRLRVNLVMIGKKCLAMYAKDLEKGYKLPFL